MKTKFKQGDKVRVVKNGKIILDNGTMICVPEKNVVKIID